MPSSSHWMEHCKPSESFHVAGMLKGTVQKSAGLESTRPVTTKERIAAWSFRRSANGAPVLMSGTPARNARPSSATSTRNSNRPLSAGRSSQTRPIHYKNTTSQDTSMTMSRPSLPNPLCFHSATLEVAAHLNEQLSMGLSNSDRPLQDLSLYSAIFARVLELSENNPLVGVLRRIKVAYEYELFTGHTEKFKVMSSRLEEMKALIGTAEEELETRDRRILALELEVNCLKRQVEQKAELLDFILTSKGIGIVPGGHIRAPTTETPSLVEIVAHHMTTSRLLDMGGIVKHVAEDKIVPAERNEDIALKENSSPPELFVPNEFSDRKDSFPDPPMEEDQEPTSPMTSFRKTGKKVEQFVDLED